MSRIPAGVVPGRNVATMVASHRRRTLVAKYLLLKHYRGGPAPVVDIPPMDQWAPAEVDAHIQWMRDFADRLQDTGEFVSHQALSPEGTFVRYDGEGRPPVTDGPFAETKDLIAGWLIIDVESYQRAVEVAGRVLRRAGPGRQAELRMAGGASVLRLPAHHRGVNETLLRDLIPAVTGVLVRRGADFATAEDAVQDALLRALATWPAEPPADPKGWLVTRDQAGKSRQPFTQQGHVGAGAQVGLGCIGDVRAGDDDARTARPCAHHHGAGRRAHRGEAHLREEVVVVLVQHHDLWCGGGEAPLVLGPAVGEHGVVEAHTMAACAQQGSHLQRRERRVRLGAFQLLGVEVDGVRMTDENGKHAGVFSSGVPHAPLRTPRPPQFRAQAALPARKCRAGACRFYGGTAAPPRPRRPGPRTRRANCCIKH